MDLSSHSLQDRVAIVTGSGRGAGRGIAVTLARHGAHVVVNDLDGDACHDTSKAVQGHGCRALVVAADVSKEADVARLVSRALAEFGRVDILVNNAAVAGTSARVLETSPAQWDRVLGVNLRGPFLLAREVGPVMKRQGKGSIINIASIAALNPYAADYSVAKAGLVMLTGVLAKEMGPYGVRANAVVPWLIITEMSRAIWGDAERMETWARSNPMGRGAEPEEIGAVVAFLASDAASYVNGAVFSATGAP